MKVKMGTMKRLLLILFLYSGVATAEGIPELKTLRWVERDLRAALVPPVNMNRVASLTFPLTSAWRQGLKIVTRDVLDEVTAYIRSADLKEFDCGQLVDIHLTIGFLEETGRGISLDPVTQTLAKCDWGNSRLDLANALFFTCRYTGDDPEKRLPGALAYLEQAQRRDGAFIAENGRPWFYLTSHALMAVHYCGGKRAVVERGKRYLLARLPEFKKAGFYDGLVESLVFLLWLGVDIPNYADYVVFIRASSNPDGGICFSRKQGCQSHWHAVSLLLELQLMGGWK